MAVLGRRNAISSASKGARGGDSEAFRRLKEEEAERERFEKEFEERQKDEGKPKPGSEPAAAAATAAPNPRVFLKVEVRGPELLGRPGQLEASGQLEFELFADLVPRTAENFRCLCTGERGRDLHFKDCTFHRIIPGFMAQGGDFTDGDGTGGRSIYGKTFADEGFPKRHEARGLLSMANSGPHTNNSQFFILFKSAPHLDRKHVVFGRLIREEGQILRRMEDRGTKSGDVKGTVKIVDCGELPTASAARSGREREKSRSRSRERRREPSRSRDRSRDRRRDRRRRERSRSRS